MLVANSKVERACVFAVWISCAGGVVAMEACKGRSSLSIPKVTAPITYQLSDARAKGDVSWPPDQRGSEYTVQTSVPVTVAWKPRGEIGFETDSVSFHADGGQITEILMRSGVGTRASMSAYLLGWSGLSQLEVRPDGKTPREAVQSWAKGTSGSSLGENVLAFSSQSPSLRLVARCANPATDEWVLQLTISW